MLPAVRAWRIEHPTTLTGPLRTAFPERCPNDEHYNLTRCTCYAPHKHPHGMPLPRAEPRLRGSASVGWRYAFRNLTELRRHFSPDVARYLDGRGYVLRCFAVPWDAHELRPINLCFDRDRAKLLREWSLAEYARDLDAQLAAVRAIQSLRRAA